MSSQSPVPKLALNARRHSIDAADENRRNIAEVDTAFNSQTSRDNFSPTKDPLLQSDNPQSPLRKRIVNTSSPGKNKYSTKSSERQATRLTSAQRLTLLVRQEEQLSPREPYKFPSPVDFRNPEIGSGKETYLPQYSQLKQLSHDAARASPPSPRFHTGKYPQQEARSSAAMSHVTPGVLDVRHKKLGDEYAFSLVQEAMRVAGGAGAAAAVAGYSVPMAPVADKMKSMLAGVCIDPEQGHPDPEDDEEAYFDLSKEIPLTHQEAQPMRTLCLRDNRLTDVGLVKILQCLHGRGSRSSNSFGGMPTISGSFVTSSGSGTRAARERRGEGHGGAALQYLAVLDLSENSIRRKGANELSKLLMTAPAMRCLKMSKMSLSDSALRSILSSEECGEDSTVFAGKLGSGGGADTKMGSLLDMPSIASMPMGSLALLAGEHIPLPATLTLTSIDFSNNKIGDPGCMPLATLLKHTQALQELNLAWNEIKDKGAVILAGAIATNQTLQKFDISWNAIGTRAEVARQVAAALSDMLAKNETLLHLDLSQNQLTTADCATISVGLAANHSVMGLHMTGNGGSLDAYGHLVPDAEPWPLESGHVMTRIIGENFENQERQHMRDTAQSKDPSHASREAHGAGSRAQGKWQLRNSCWICGCFRENKFEYTLTQKSIRHLLKEAAPSAPPSPVQGGIATTTEGSDEKFEAELRAQNKNTSLSGEEASSSSTKVELPHSFNRPISIRLATSFDKWVAEEMNPAENTGSEAYSHNKSSKSGKNRSPGSTKNQSINLKGYRLHATQEDQRACVLAAGQYAFSAEEARKEMAEVAAASALYVPKSPSGSSKKSKKGGRNTIVKKDGNAKFGPATKEKEPKPPKSSPSKGHRRTTIKKSKAPANDPHTARITPEAFKAKMVFLQSKMAGVGNLIGTGGGTGENNDLAVLDHLQDMNTHEHQHNMEEKEDRDTFDYSIDENDDWYAYYGGDINPKVDHAKEKEEAEMAKLLGQKVRKTVRVQHGFKPRPKFELHRMVPPGVHYYALSVNGGALTFDPFKPHVSTASLVELGMYVPSSVDLPPFLNKMMIDAPTEEERMEGITSFITPAVKPRLKNSEAAQYMKPWTFKDSIFYNQTAKHEAAHVGRCFFKDWSYTKAAKGKVQADVDAIENVMRKHYTLCCAVFFHYAALYSTEVYFMSMGAFNEFIQRTKIIDGEQGRRVTVVDTSANEAPLAKESSVDSKNSAQPVLVPPATDVPIQQSIRGGNAMNGTCTRTEVELIFVSACITGPRHEFNSKRALARFQFLDCLVSIANVKFVKSGRCSNVAEAVEFLLKENVMVWAEREKHPLIKRASNGGDSEDDVDDEDDDDDDMDDMKPNALRGRIVGEPLTVVGTAFRLRFLYTKQCDDMIRKYLPQFQRIFKRFSGAENTPLEENTMSFKEWLSFTDVARLQTDEFLTERMSKLTYVRSKWHYEDCFDESESFKKLTFSEFLECVVRAAYSMYLEKRQATFDGSMIEGGSGMGSRSTSNAVLLRQASSLSAVGALGAAVPVALEASKKTVVIQDVPDITAHIAPPDDSVTGVADFLHVIELIAKKRV